MKYSEELTQEICKYLKAGNSQLDSATLAGISEETFYTWKKEKVEFSEAVKKAESECKARSIALILKAGEQTWQAAAWWLERKYPDEFALKQKNEITGANGEPIKLFVNAGQGFVPATVGFHASSAGSFTEGQPPVQSSDMAPQGKEDNNGPSGDGQASTP